MHTLASWPEERGYELVLPDCQGPLPLVVAIHGYTHDSKAMERLTSPTGEPSHPDSLSSLARREGFALAYPNGTRLGVLPGRGWNAGGGKRGFAPVSNPSVRRKVDDVSYFRDLLDDIAARIEVDPRRIYVTGISNGGAMAHRLAMQLKGRLAAVASVAAANQFAAAEKRVPKHPIPVLMLHGSKDPLWPYAGGRFMVAGQMVAVQQTVNEWAACNECGPVVTTQTGSVVRESRPGPNPVELYRLEGAGHSWPGGRQYLSESYIGVVSRDLNANRVIWDFFREHSRPG